MSTHVVRAATPEDLPAAAAVLAAAFADYPWTRWTVDGRDHVERIRGLQLLALERVGLPSGQVWVATADDAVVSVAAWTEDAVVPSHVWDEMDAEVRVLEGDRHAASRAAELACQPLRPTIRHRILGTVGTHPDHQRRGIAAALLAPGLRACEAAGVTAYLETSTAANVSFYERLGFEVTGRVDITAGPTVWAMTR
jgi:ribosomal protein S18 acetylase RimI-like enzyme